MNLSSDIPAAEAIEFDVCNGTCYLWTFWCLMTRGITLPFICFPYKYMTSQEVKFHDGKLIFSYDWWCLRQEKTVPLDRIQDVDINENCLQRCCAIAEISVKTASGGRNSSVTIVAPRNPAQVRNQIMAHRDAFMHGQPTLDVGINDSIIPTNNEGVELARSHGEEQKPLLSNITNKQASAATWNDTLCRIESRLSGILETQS